MCSISWSGRGSESQKTTGRVGHLRLCNCGPQQRDSRFYVDPETLNAASEKVCCTKNSGTARIKVWDILWKTQTVFIKLYDHFEWITTRILLISQNRRKRLCRFRRKSSTPLSLDIFFYSPLRTPKNSSSKDFAWINDRKRNKNSLLTALGGEEESRQQGWNARCWHLDLYPLVHFQTSKYIWKKILQQPTTSTIKKTEMTGELKRVNVAPTTFPQSWRMVGLRKMNDLPQKLYICTTQIIWKHWRAVHSSHWNINTP